MLDLTVASIDYARLMYREYDAIITIEDKFFRDGLRISERPQLILKFDDLEKEEPGLLQGYGLCQASHIRAAFAFAQMHRGRSILLHCHAGISRSPTLAMAIQAWNLPAGHEDEAVQSVYAKNKKIYPNSLVARMADVVMCRNNAFSDSVEKLIQEINIEDKENNQPNF